MRFCQSPFVMGSGNKWLGDSQSELFLPAPVLGEERGEASEATLVLQWWKWKAGGCVSAINLQQRPGTPAPAGHHDAASCPALPLPRVTQNRLCPRVFSNETMILSCSCSPSEAAAAAGAVTTGEDVQPKVSFPPVHCFYCAPHTKLLCWMRYNGASGAFGI